MQLREYLEKANDCCYQCIPCWCDRRFMFCSSLGYLFYAEGEKKRKMTFVLDIAESFEEHQTQIAAILSRIAHSGQTWGSETFFSAIVIPTVERIRDDERSDFDCMSVALLMNAINNTELSFDDCAAIGFHPNILQALHILFERANEEYFEHIMRLAECPLCRFVKLHELRVRLEKTSEKEGDFKKYNRAIATLEGYDGLTLSEGDGERPSIN